MPCCSYIIVSLHLVSYLNVSCGMWKGYCLCKADCDSSTFKDVIISNRLWSLTRNQRCQHEAKLVSDVTNNPKRFWHYVNSSLKARPDIDALQCLDESLSSSDHEYVKLLNLYFSSVYSCPKTCNTGVKT